MNWYLNEGKDSDIVINSKVVYSRNLRNYKFETNSDDKGRIYFKKIYNDYVLELGIYISKVIENYLIKDNENL